MIQNRNNIIRPFSVWMTIFLSPVLWSHSAISQPMLKVHGYVDIGHDGNPHIKGKAEISNWNSESKCLYLPLNESDYGHLWHINQHLKMIGKKNLTKGTRHGKMSISGTKIEMISDSIYRVHQNSQNISFEFNTSLKLKGLKQPDDFFFDDFIPSPLKECPADASDRKQRFSKLTFSGSIKPPPQWEIISILSESKIELPKISIGIVRSYHKNSISIDGLELQIYRKKAPFSRIEETVKSAISSHLKWLGNFPYKKIYVVESSEFQSPTMPGIITINQPKQSLFKTLQREWLNWSHWAVTTLLAYQWYIPHIHSSQAKDLWFYRGLIDFLTELALRVNSTRYSLFNSFDLGFSVISMNYKDFQNLTAALLEKYAPYSRLTNDNFDSFSRFESQHPLVFIRHTMAMRHLLTLAGERGLKRILQKIQFPQNTSNFSAPKAFISSLNQTPSPFSSVKRKLLTKTLNKWWTNSGWPDYEIDSIKTSEITSGRYMTDIHITSKGDFHFPVPVRVTDESGTHKMSIAQPSQGDSYQTTVVTRFKPSLIEIDHDRSIYDRDRFNNTNKGFELEFFPGSAQTLKDDVYTLVWLPYIQKQPGENLSLGIQANIFKYISGELIVRFEVQADGRSGYSLIKKDKIPRYSMDLETSILQNFDGFRETRLALNQSSLIGGRASLNLSGTVRERRIVGAKNTSHGTFALGAMIQPNYQKKGCSHLLSSELEVAPESTSHSFQYSRMTSFISALCQFGTSYAASLRLFKGDLKTKSAVPKNILFNPQSLTESRIRLDIDGLNYSEDIASVSSDLYLPLMIPLPTDTLLLSKQLKWRLFYDYGMSTQPKATMSGTGIGILMPLGGDFIGAGSLALTRLSLLAILHSRLNQDHTSRPTILFDISGQL